MHALKKAVAGVTLGAALTASWFVGNRLVNDVQFARAEQQVEASRQQIANVQDLAAVYKAVGKAVEPSVVSIDVRKTVQNVSRRNQQQEDMLRRFFPDRDRDGEPDLPEGFQIPDGADEYQQAGLGSGVIIEVDGSTGYIVTNNHVAGNASELTVTLSDGRAIHDAKLVGADPKSDIAVVKITADRLIPAKWGDSEALEKGDIVMAFGSPFGYVGSMTHGIISALNRQAGIISGQFAYENFIQTDASINPGNSGGPLVNLKGEVIGINTAIATRTGGFQGVGFAVPAQQAKFVYSSIKEKGKVVRGWLGVGIKDVAKFPEVATAQGWTESTGVIVEQLVNNTPAYGKLQPGDIVLKVNGDEVKDVQALRKKIAATAPGEEVTLNVFRGKKKEDVKVKLGEQPDDYRAVAAGETTEQHADSGKNSFDALGIKIATLNETLASRYSIEEGTQGAVITNVKPGSPAAQAGLRSGDVVTKVEDTTVTSPAEASEALSKADVSKGVKLLVTDRDGTRFAFVKPAK